MSDSRLAALLGLATAIVLGATATAPAFAQNIQKGSPVYGSPAYGVPVYGAPAYGVPVYGAPVYGAPAYGAPVYGGYGGGYSNYGYGSSYHPPLGSQMYAPNNYYNNGGIGYGGYPGVVYGAPAPVAGTGGFFRFGNLGGNYWRSNSGYYYPWGGGTSVNQTIIYQQGATSAQPSKPPISTVLNDMERYISEAKEKGRCSQADYDHLTQRITDLRRKLSNMMNNAEGANLDPQDEDYFRRDLDTLSKDISQRIKI